MALALAFVFIGCEISCHCKIILLMKQNPTVTGYYITHMMRNNFFVGDARDVDYNSCSSSYSTSYSYAFDFSQYDVIEYYDNGSRITSTTYYVSDVEAFSYGGDIFIAYDVGGGLTFEYNNTDDEVGVYEDGIVDYYY
jgi:hypothetical protein